ncbi:MAG: class II D-tagatose-bisphosphate aldolase, non-catalytic subunit [Bacteroidota bacterium]
MVRNARDIFLGIVADNRRSGTKGIYSVCSANADVLEACFIQAKEDDSILLIESTSNQVDQYGGYTGMKPAEFAGFVYAIATKTGFPREMILLGGDHLGPNKWQELPASEAMIRAEELIKEYVKAGFQKIHIDTSMFCADDPGDRKNPLGDEVVASRAAVLCRVAEDTWKKYCKNSAPPLYIIGSEVPVPGGAQQKEEIVIPTKPEDVARTIDITRKIFFDAALSDAWERVVAVVVQPGVEFGDDRVFTYNRDLARGLSNKITGYDNLVYETHSTDYQSEGSLRALVEDCFCILKVGPWLTFAYREALYALEAIEVEMMGDRNLEMSNLKETLDKVMRDDPKHWEKYYSGTEHQQFFKRKYSFSDRSRYYWPYRSVRVAKDKLFENLRKNRIPLSLLSQFMPTQFFKVLNGTLTNDPKEIVLDYIRITVGVYSRACGLSE